MTNAGIIRIVYGEFYRDARIFDVAARLGIELLHLAPQSTEAVSSALPNLVPEGTRDSGDNS
jgi:dCMP deaminase